MVHRKILAFCQNVLIKKVVELLSLLNKNVNDCFFIKKLILKFFLLDIITTGTDCSLKAMDLETGKIVYSQLNAHE